ncbi:MAG: hypothetical protein ACHQ49_00260 [Elusimicrobiota bacterium]
MMKTLKRRVPLLIAAVFSLLAVAGGDGLAADSAPYHRTNDEFLRQWQWPERSRLAAQAMIEKYGLPTRTNESELVWYNNGPWLRTVVHRESWRGFLGTRDNDIVDQAIAYRVTADERKALERFSKRIVVDEAAGELISRSESENLNFLALNLAGEIAGGMRTVKDALKFFARTEELSKAGKSSAYLERFVFPVGGGIGGEVGSD